MNVLFYFSNKKVEKNIDKKNKINYNNKSHHMVTENSKNEP